MADQQAVLIRRVGPVSARVAGTGPAVLLLHGIGGSAASFAAQQRELSGFTTIAWDAPGYGASADPAAAVAAEPADHYAGMAVDLLRGLGHERAHVVGVSWGGVIATRVALRFPATVRSLTLAGSSRGGGVTVAGRAAMLSRIEELTARGATAFAALHGPRLLAPGAPAVLVGPVVAIMARVRLAGYSAAAEMMAATDHSAELGRIEVPTLVLSGEGDQVIGAAESAALAAGVSGARLVVVPAGGHAVNQGNAPVFTKRLRRFLTEVDSRVVG